MKYLLSTLTLFFALTLAVSAQSKQEKEVSSAVDQLRTAIVDGDRANLEKMTTKELSYGHSSGLIEDQDTFVESLASGKSDFKSMDLTDQTIEVAGNAAIVRHKLDAEVVDNGEEKSVKLGILMVFQKQQGQWKLLARQAYKI